MTPRTVVVTGGAGFIGSHLVDALLADELRVVVVDDLSSGKPERVAPAAELEQVDISDSGALAAVIDAARPERIFHLAAQSSVTVSVNDPTHDCRVNVQGTLNVLEAAARHGAPHRLQLDWRRAVRRRCTDPDRRGSDSRAARAVRSLEVGR